MVDLMGSSMVVNWDLRKAELWESQKVERMAELKVEKKVDLLEHGSAGLSVECSEVKLVEWMVRDWVGLKAARMVDSLGDPMEYQKAVLMVEMLVVM